MFYFMVAWFFSSQTILKTQTILNIKKMGMKEKKKRKEKHQV